MELGALNAVLPDRIRVVLLKIAPQAIERNGRPLPVPGADSRGGLCASVDPFTFSMVELLRKSVGDAQTFLIREHRAFLDQVPEQYHHMCVVVIRPTERFFLVLNAFAVNPGYLLTSFFIRECQSEKLASVGCITGHVVHGHPLADAVPAEVTHRSIPFRCLPCLELTKVCRNADSLAEFDLCQPTNRKCIFRNTNLVQLCYKCICGSVHAHQVTSPHEDHIVAVTEGIVECAYYVPSRPGIAEIEERIVAVIQLADSTVGGPIAQNDEMSTDRHGPSWRLIGSDRHLDTCEFSDSLLDAFCLLFVDT